jgi:hypothetical protein
LCVLCRLELEVHPTVMNTRSGAHWGATIVGVGPIDDATWDVALLENISKLLGCYSESHACEVQGSTLFHWPPLRNKAMDDGVGSRFHDQLTGLKAGSIAK